MQRTFKPSPENDLFIRELCSKKLWSLTTALNACISVAAGELNADFTPKKTEKISTKKASEK